MMTGGAIRPGLRRTAPRAHRWCVIPPDPSLYGDNFADVYDKWYADRLGSPDEVVAFLDRVLEPAAARSVVELGIGTGRLALPLQRAGWRVIGIESSPRMIDQLSDKTGSANIEVICGDAALPATWVFGPVDVVLASFNFLHTLIEPTAAPAVLAHAAAALAPGGCVIVEHDVIDLAGAPADSTVASDLVEGLRIRTVVDARTGVVHGTHIEPNGRARSWQLRPRPPAEYDALAALAGLELSERWSSWTGDPFDAGSSARAISLYRMA